MLWGSAPSVSEKVVQVVQGRFSTPWAGLAAPQQGDQRRCSSGSVAHGGLLPQRGVRPRGSRPLRQPRQT